MNLGTSFVSFVEQLERMLSVFKFESSAFGGNSILCKLSDFVVKPLYQLTYSKVQILFLFLVEPFGFLIFNLKYPRCPCLEKKTTLPFHSKIALTSFTLFLF